MQSALLVIHVLLSLSLIGLVLIQQGKGADAGAAFGGGSSSAVFGASGAGSFLTKLTTGLAIAFFATSLGLAYISALDVTDKSIVDELSQNTEKDAVESVQSSTDLPAVIETENASGDLPVAKPNEGLTPEKEKVRDEILKKIQAKRAAQQTSSESAVPSPEKNSSLN